jgi:hypothetical protein
MSNSTAIWSNIVLLHLWGAVNYIKPGWLPTLAGVLTLLIVISLVCHQDKPDAATGSPR